ncbi:armadillo-type protein [Cladochytrium replicatum]|nr:armadillo-type protein [Cladochytrium replicatum]
MSGRAQAPATATFKQRKREAVVKYEPTAFRDSLLAVIGEPTDNENYSQILEQNAEKLDYKRYGEPFFEITIVGGLIAPGGNILDDGAPKNPYSIFAGETTDVKVRVEILCKLIRRYKYLQRKLEDCLAPLLQYVNKFGANTEKLSMAVGYLISNQMVAITVLLNVIKEHLVKEGVSLQFVTNVFKYYLEEQSIDHLATSLKKSGMDDKLLEFFPPNKRGEEYLVRHFEAEGLTSLVTYYKKRQVGALKDGTKDKFKEMFESGKSPVEIVTYAKQQLGTNNWTEQDLIPIVWDAMILAVDWGTRPEQIESQLTKQVTSTAKVLAALSTSAKTELSLILKVQAVCYEDARFLKHFRNIMTLFYKHDVVSESAILYWYEKGAATQGKTTFLKQMEPFVTWLRSQEDDDDEDEE